MVRVSEREQRELRYPQQRKLYERGATGQWEMSSATAMTCDICETARAAETLALYSGDCKVPPYRTARAVETPVNLTKARTVEIHAGLTTALAVEIRVTCTVCTVQLRFGADIQRCCAHVSGADFSAYDKPAHGS